ncbi:MAG: hypothetical protein JWM58_501 [Rhizobium sp.]|nr:hypothetical protein [Rhizobium sp.]
MRHTLIGAILFLASMLLGALPAQAMEVIQSYHADIDLDKSGRMTVTETIRVLAENYKIKHGIFRDFPLTFSGDDGEMHRVDFKIIGVKRDDQTENFKAESIDNGTRIVIGREDVAIPPGEHTYEIKYETGRQIRYFAKHDELFWNVTGTGWEFPINEATATVNLPAGVKPEATVFYTGPLGSTEKNARVREAGGAAYFATTIPLNMREGLTIGVKFPKGAIDPPTDSDKFWWAVHDRLNSITAGLCLLIVLLYFSIQWVRVGRDPSRGVVVPRWDPPAGLSPALVNYVANRGFSNGGWTAFSASAINLAVKGLITLEDLKKAVRLKSTGKAPADKLPIGEDKIYNFIKAAGAYFTLSKENGRKIQSLGDDFRIAIDKEHRGKYHRYNLGVITGGIILTILAYLAVLVIGDFNENMLGLLIVPAFIFVFVAVFSAVLAATALSAPVMVLRVFAGIFIFFFWLAFAVIITVSTIGAFEAARSQDDIFAYGASCAMILIAAFFVTIMGAATPLGRELRDGVEGLRLYLTVAEKDRMNFAGAPEMSPRHFEKLLPYAVALGVEKPWSEQFQKWLDAAGAAAASYHPTWYGGQDFNSNRFGERISGFSSSLSSTIASTLPPPPSSSSSGFSSSSSSGGSSGGGGGGGGW